MRYKITTREELRRRESHGKALLYQIQPSLGQVSDSRSGQGIRHILQASAAVGAVESDADQHRADLSHCVNGGDS